MRLGLASTADEQAYHALINGTYQLPTPLAYYRWEFFGRTGQGRCLFAERDGELLGVDGVRFLQERRPRGMSAGLMVEVVVRAGNEHLLIMPRLETELEQIAAARGCDFLYAFPGIPGFRPRVNSLNWRVLRPINVSTCDVKPVTARPTRLRFQRISRFGTDHAGIVESYARAYPGRLVLARDASFLNWRFRRNPEYRYDTYVAFRSSIPVAYIVLRYGTAGDSTGLVVDLLWAEPRKGLPEELLAFANARFQERGMRNSSMWLNCDEELEAAALHAGYRRSSVSHLFCLKYLNGRAAEAFDVGQWYFTMADSEVY